MQTRDVKEFGPPDSGDRVSVQALFYPCVIGVREKNYGKTTL